MSILDKSIHVFPQHFKMVFVFKSQLSQEVLRHLKHLHSSTSFYLSVITTLSFRTNPILIRFLAIVHVRLSNFRDVTLKYADHRLKNEAP